MKANSKTKFSHSGTITPNKKEVFKAITKESAKVRTWAGRDNHECFFSPLPSGTIISVCDAILSDRGNLWYYISYEGHYGFVYAERVEKVSDKTAKFLHLLGIYHTYIKKHAGHFKYGYDSGLDTFGEAKKKVEKGKIASITCVVPIRWALKELGIKRADGKSLLVAYDGTFSMTYTGGIQKAFKRITKGEAIGRTVTSAVDKGLLKAGDILCFEGYTHTFVYSGVAYIAYDGGRAAIKDGHYTGIKVDYSKSNKNRKISEIIRWRT